MLSLSILAFLFSPVVCPNPETSACEEWVGFHEKWLDTPNVTRRDLRGVSGRDAQVLCILNNEMDMRQYSSHETVDSLKE